MAYVDGRWQLGIGDPTVVGWLTVAAYAGAAWMCWRARRTPAATPASAARFWVLVAAVMLLLAFNKQLDLQGALTQFARDLALAEGWYRERRAVQLAFIGWVVLAGLMAGGYLVQLARPPSPGRGIALAGIALVIVFVLVRAASFHHVDLVLTETALGLRWNWILELSGIACVAAGALRESRRPAAAAPTRPRAAPSPPAA
ncbi:MAG TPA: hypothetical protein VLI72_06695, partial [Methylibium sp.]|nr:hypothetical protein [Methylibium sp.]